MKHIELHFDPELAGFFRVRTRVLYPLTRKASIKDIIEAQGIPHTEVGALMADGLPADFQFIPEAGQKICIQGIQAPVDLSRATLLRPRPWREIRFVVDVNVGRLAPMLRMLGYDTYFEPGIRDGDIALLAHEQQRIVLSRDRGLLKHGLIQAGRLVRSGTPREQFMEVAAFFGLSDTRAFSRCLRCNLELKEVEKKQIMHRLEPGTKKYFNRFSMCPGCLRIYWPGSHWEKMNGLMKMVAMVTGHKTG